MLRVIGRGREVHAFFQHDPRLLNSGSALRAVKLAYKVLQVRRAIELTLVIPKPMCPHLVEVEWMRFMPEGRGGFTDVDRVAQEARS